MTLGLKKEYRVVDKYRILLAPAPTSRMILVREAGRVESPPQASLLHQGLFTLKYYSE